MQHTPIKLVAIDMDGTLLNSHQTIPDRNKKAITAAKAKGITVVLCTGRPYTGVYPYLKELNLTSENDYVIMMNGAITTNVQTKQPVNTNCLTHAQWHQLAIDACERHINAHAITDHSSMILTERKVGYYSTLDAYFTHQEILTCCDPKATTDTIAKFMWADTPEKISQNLATLSPYLKDTFYVVQTAPYFVEFLNPQATKGAAMLALAKQLGIKPENTMAIGDQNNDEPMISAAGIGVAMQNAVDNIKHIADATTSCNNDGGVGEAIERFVLQAK